MQFILDIVFYIILFLIGAACLIYIVHPIWFVKIPQNHVVCVEVGGKFKHYMAHAVDKDRINGWLQTLATKPMPIVPTDFKISQVVVREKHFILQVFVKWFNWHLKSWNPFATLREIEILRTKINPSPASDNISDAISYSNNERSPEKTKFLRLEFPRVATMLGVELDNNVEIDLVWTITKIWVYDLYTAFYSHSNISVWIDELIVQAVANFLGTMSFDEFQRAKRYADPTTPFNLFLMNTAGITSTGVMLGGPAAISQFRLGASQQELKKAEARKAAATANAEALQIETGAEADKVRTLADAEADRIKREGDAKAHVIRTQGTATGDAAEKLRKAIGGDDAVARVLAAEALGGPDSKIVTLVMGDQKGTPPVIIQP